LAAVAAASIIRSRSVALIAVLVAAILLGSAIDAGAKPDRSRHRIDVSGATKNVGKTKDGALIDRGTVTGKPFGHGKIRIVVKLDFVTSTATGTFRVRDHRGTAFGTVDMTFVINGDEITFDGTADLTGGKGRYKGISGRDLRAHDHNTLDGQNGTISLRGFARW
jgi:hypothetical protein